MIACPESGVPIRVPPRPFTEADWLAGTDPQAMLNGLPAAVLVRSLRLFAVACCRRIEARLTHRLSRQALELVERHADGRATDEELAASSARVREAHRWRHVVRRRATTALDAVYAMTVKAFPAAAAARALDAAADRAKEQAAQWRLLRCVFGNPLRPVPVIDPAWLSWQDGTVERLARAAYDERRLPDGTLDETRLAVLADALEEVGCENVDLLGHLREPGPHVRGCRALDVLLVRH
jgi:hypothetical protein